MSIAQGDAYRKMVTLSEELAVAHEILAVKLPWIDHLEREYAKMRRSETWRMGLIVGAPIRWTKSLARLGRKKDQE